MDTRVRGDERPGFKVKLGIRHAQSHDDPRLRILMRRAGSGTEELMARIEKEGFER